MTTSALTLCPYCHALAPCVVKTDGSLVVGNHKDERGAECQGFGLVFCVPKGLRLVPSVRKDSDGLSGFSDY